MFHAFLLLSFALATGPTERSDAAPPRSYSYSVSLKEKTALRIDMRSPRIEASELEKMLAKPDILSALNAQHFANLGTIKVAQPMKLGGSCFDAGAYSLGVALDSQGNLSLRLSTAAVGETIALETKKTAEEVAQVSVAFLAQKDVESFDLEIRVGHYRGIATLDFSMTRVIVQLNNSANALLAKADKDQNDVLRALYYSSKATAMTSAKNPLILDTYASALFQSGQVDKAVATQQRAIELIDPSYEKHRPAMLNRLKTYRGGKG